MEQNGTTDPNISQQNGASNQAENNCDSEVSEPEPDGPECSEELGRVVIKPNEVDALELDFQHCKIPKIENLEVLTKIENLGFRCVMFNYEEHTLESS